MTSYQPLLYQKLHLVVQDDFFLELSRLKTEKLKIELSRIRVDGIVSPSSLEAPYPMLKLTKESFTTFADKRINPYEMVIRGYLTIYNTQMEYNHCNESMEREQQEINQSLSSLGVTPLFYLHVFPDMKHHYSYKAQLPCYSPTLQFASTVIPEENYSNMNKVLEIEDYGDQSYPTVLLENSITSHYLHLFHQLQNDSTIILPCWSLLHIHVKQKKHSTIQAITIPITFDQLTESPCLQYENGFDSDSERGFRCLNIPLENKGVQTEAIHYNIQLMKWRLFPSLDDFALANLRVLLIGAGTVGCAVARALIGWGITHLTIVDSGVVSPSNLTRQCLYSWNDCSLHQGQSRFKAVVAAQTLKTINPAIDSQGIVFSIPMVNHEEEDVRERIIQLCEWIDESDVIFLMTDLIDSKWLPAVLSCLSHSLCISISLDGSSFTIQRYGRSLMEYGERGFHHPTSLHTCLSKGYKHESVVSNDSCCFCGESINVGNMITDRGMDQLCTTTRIGLSYIASGMAVELMINYLHYSMKDRLGEVPQYQIYMNLHDFVVHSYKQERNPECCCCGNLVQQCLQQGGIDFLEKCLRNDQFLMKTSNLVDYLNQVSSTL